MLTVGRHLKFSSWRMGP